MSFQNTISMKEFCKRNCGNMSKEKFYEEYYRIIHTAYLRCEGKPCIETIRDDFENAFGSKLDNISISYIYATTKYLVYDVVVSSLLGDGRIDSQYYYNKLVIDIGFDVWLIKSIESEVRLTMNDFYSWQPLPKNDRTDRQIYDFWHFKLPNSRNFGHLYSAVVPYKKLIYNTYYKLLKANTDYENDPKQLEALIAFLEEELAKMGVITAEKTVQSEESVAQSVFETELADEVEKAEDQDLSIDEDFIDLDGETPDKESEDMLLENADNAETVEPASLQDALTKDLDETIEVLDVKDEPQFFGPQNPVQPLAEPELQAAEEVAEQAVEQIWEQPIEQLEEQIEEPVEDQINEQINAQPEEHYPLDEEKKDDIIELHTTEDMLAAQPKVNIRVVEPVSDPVVFEPVKSEEPVKPVSDIRILTPEETFTEAAKRISEAAKSFAKNTINKVSETANKGVKGFKDGKISVTKKKVVTAAVCLALAGTVVVPLAIMLGKGRKR